MEISQTASAAAQTSQNANATQPQRTALSSDFETFIKMLTTQMQNQDPLNPIESADFAVQLATFSTVEQQVKTNDLLTSLADRIAGQGVAQLSGWVGMTARAEMPVAFNGTPVSLTVKSAPLADSAELVVRDSAGDVVLRQPAPATSGALDWAGVDDTGAPLPLGTYSITLESFKGGELLEANAVEVHERIVEARTENGQTFLVMAGGQEIPADDVLGLRETGS
ncbi:flagellar hook capping FlgD N-terminal domain-containing protein [Roseovarius aestuarii]|uniref:Basal-body rod modification protein FlgD n=1 Tax=Roseovarius aestuarii TaxID=475083 RepID=A0A1X7BQJ8_9RHOB|nr:flagellar hook capping FlgD N-terminal domain-containing protein [Roseovarius aestuarii]SMC11881.1 Basal-body rod modification protein FlgD [Roseovarius aestuarii]